VPTHGAESPTTSDDMGKNIEYNLTAPASRHPSFVLREKRPSSFLGTFFLRSIFYLQPTLASVYILDSSTEMFSRDDASCGGTSSHRRSEMTSIMITSQESKEQRVEELQVEGCTCQRCWKASQHRSVSRRPRTHWLVIKTPHWNHCLSVFTLAHVEHTCFGHLTCDIATVLLSIKIGFDQVSSQPDLLRGGFLWVVSGTGDKVSERSDGTSYVDGLEAVRSLGSEGYFQDSCPHA
jgi:hypothetical protein